MTILAEGQPIKHATTKNGMEVFLRYPSMDDVPAMLEFINALSKERTFLHVQGKQFTYNEERDYVAGALRSIQKGDRVQVLAFVDGELAGSTEITRDPFDSNRHRGGLGISVAQKFRGQGVGELLMRTVIEEAKARLEGVRLVTLTVFGNNPNAIRLYEKVGFVEYGRLPGGVLHRDQYVDEVYMAKRL